MRIFLNDEKQTDYRIIHRNESEMLTIRVNSTNCDRIRPFIVAAVLRNITFNDENYNSFIKLQEKLHFNICRHRSLVAIGTHDLDTLSPNFIYDARSPNTIVFRALKEENEMNCNQLFDKYRNDVKSPTFSPSFIPTFIYTHICISH